MVLVEQSRRIAPTRKLVDLGGDLEAKESANRMYA